MAVARAGRGFRVVLHREHRLVFERDAAIGAVEQRHMRLLDILRQRVLVDREAVVHRSDLDLAGGQVLHRMIGAVMALMHLHGFAADRDAQHLMAEANAKRGRAAIDQLLDHRHGVLPGRRRIARPIRQEHAVGLERHDVLGRGLGRHHRHLAARTGEQAQNVALDAVVDGDHVEIRTCLAAEALPPHPRRLVPGKALPRGHHRYQVHADQAGPGRGFFLQRGEIEFAVARVRDHGIRHALDADQRGQRAGIDAAKPDNAARLQPVVEVAGGAVVRRRRDGAV